MTTINVELPKELDQRLDDILRSIRALERRLENRSPFVDVAEAAMLLGVTKDTIRARVRNDHLPSKRNGGKKILIPRDALSPTD